MSPSGYVTRRYAKGQDSPYEAMHRLVMGLELRDGLQVDHIDRCKTNNRRANLRLCTSQENAENYTPREHFTSQHRGVHWDPKWGKWVATVYRNRKRVFCKAFDSEQEAAQAAQEARMASLPFATD